MTHRRRTRRIAPALFALAIAAISSTTIWTNWFSEQRANVLVLGIAAGGFLFKALLFSYMKHRMTAQGRRLTLFGEAIVDYFVSLVVLDIIVAGVFLTLLEMAVRLQPVPRWVVLTNRTAINGGVALILGTGVAVAWEMHKAGDRIAVHEDHAPWDGTVERRSGDERRIGWRNREGA